jgi:cysteine sulfinate desulfinase/cysteine desulfurase-like protein
MQRIYLDHNATTPLDPSVLDAMMPYLTDTWGNPSSMSWFGLEARRGIDRARQRVADLIGSEAAEVVLCSGGTEACNMAIFGAVEGTGRHHVVTTSIEHQAVMSPCMRLEAQGYRVSIAPVDRWDALEARLVSGIAGARVLGHPVLRVPNTLDLLVPGLDGMLLMMSLDSIGIAVSHGSACGGGSAGPPTALTAMGLSPDEASSTIRISLGRGTTEDEVQRVAEALPEVVARLRDSLGRPAA